MSEASNSWFDFVEEYYSKTTVPLSWTLIGGGRITSMRCAGSPSAMTTLSKREWNRIISEDNAPRRNLPRGVALKEGGTVSNINDLPAFPPPGFTKENAEKLLKMIEEAKEKAKNEQH